MLRVQFLGTGAAVPTKHRNTSAIYVNHQGTEFLFDCGEGTQRQMRAFETGFSVDHVIITHGDGDHTLGLPGLVSTLEFTGREKPLTIHAPVGSETRVRRLVKAGNANPSFPLQVRPVTPGGTAISSEKRTVRTYSTEHRDSPSMGVVIDEGERAGRFDAERAQDLGVPPGPLFGALQNGESVTLDDGTTVQPEEVVGPPRRGRRLVYTGDTRPTERTVNAAHEADVLIHEATFASDQSARAKQAAHSTAAEAGEIAAQANVERLVVTHISPRYGLSMDQFEQDIEAVFSGPYDVATDGFSFTVPYSDKPAR